MFRLVFTALTLIVMPCAVVGAPVQLIHGLSSSYIPGQPTSFEVRLPVVSNLGSYNVDLVLESNFGTAGVDYFFEPVLTLPATTNYVFPSTANYFDAVTTDSATRDRITLTDFDITGVNVVGGLNDRVAIVVFRTLSTFSAPLRASVDSSLLIFDTPDIQPTPIAGFNALQSDIAAAGVIPMLAAPEPASSVLLMFATFGWYLRRRRAL